MPNFFCLNSLHRHEDLGDMVACEFRRFAQANKIILEQCKTAEEAAAVTGLMHLPYPQVEPVDFIPN